MPEHDVGIGDGRRRAAAAVAGGTGLGARAFGPDPQDAGRVDARDRSAAGAERDDVEARQRDLWPATARSDETGRSPLRTIEMSVDVPPMSKGMRLPSPADCRA